MIYRNRKLLDLAHRIHVCQFKLPGCKGYEVDGCEPCHSNQSAHGKGGGIKAADDQHVAGCSNCHRLYDGQRGKPLPRAVAVQAFNEGRERTFSIYEKNGWLSLVGYVWEKAA
jgi:hypothetical protein